MPFVHPSDCVGCFLEQGTKHGASFLKYLSKIPAVVLRFSEFQVITLGLIVTYLVGMEFVDSM